MTLLVDRLLEELARVPILDPHTHINPHAPSSTSFNDFLGYHYYTELAHSAGLPKSEIEHADEEQLAHRLLSTLASASNTVQYQWLVEIAQVFLGHAKPEVEESDAAQLLSAARAKMASPTWTDHVFAQTNLEGVFLTNDFDDPLEGFDTRRSIPCLRTDDLVFKLDQPAVARRWESATGGSVRDVARGLGQLFEHFVRHGARACAISLPPDFEPARPDRGSFDAALDKVALGRADLGDRRQVAHGVLYEIADHCEAFGLPFDLMIGVHRSVYQAGVYQGQDLFDQRTSLYQFRRLLNDKPRVTFPISVLTHAQNQELASYAWIFPNVVTSGHWWYANIPAYIEPDLRGRLEAVPMTKQIGYYSDAYKLEFVLPKFRLYRRCLARVLANDFILARGWSEERALSLGQTVLRGNVERIFPSRG
jgi:glucuronate isomerase